jgi:hypothetical protein
MNRQSWVRFAYSRPGGPIAILLLFIICSTPFLALGSLFNTSYSPITALPLYPNIRTLMLPTATTVGLASAPSPTPNPVVLPESVPNYAFTTTDSHETVVRFYKTTLEKIYGAQSVRVEASDSNLTTLYGTRVSRYNIWVVEQTTVTVSTGPDGVTHVDLRLDARPR